MEAFVLISNGSSGDTDSAVTAGAEVGTWTAQGLGEFDAIVKIEADSLSDLRQQGRALRMGGPLRIEFLVVVRPRPCPVKRTAEPPGTEVALALLELRPGQQAAAVAQLRAWEQDGKIAAWVIVTGSVDVVVELWGRDDEELQAAAERLQDLPGLQRQRTTYVETTSRSRV